MKSPVCVYVDNSNIFHEGQRFASEKRGEDRYAFRLHFARFIDLVTGGQAANEIVWGGSTPPTTDDVWRRLGERGIQPHLIPRAASGENETVDHVIQLQMYRHARKYGSTPGTMVVCTGDGKGYDNEEGFLFDVEGFVKAGWQLRVVSWTHSCSARLKDFANRYGKFVALEDHYDDVTFLQGGRRAGQPQMASNGPVASVLADKLKAALNK
ncbi:NYN domain-containing protein [Burkholderia gladioli]|uniref:NYN domain-containing protein n=1 Tax=Burkholderia gladioli TaxID=28095 RepID=UPI0022D752FE|nr:NYN domain-containing protein [Burkholderia gladioli]MDA0574098.1 NYN domain-containing protein [Burkholderia gladioli]MDA0602333.1 NYN domain-containing protein [Burkholderia gladioli]